jgi:hypothetical protein
MMTYYARAAIVWRRVYIANNLRLTKTSELVFIEAVLTQN